MGSEKPQYDLEAGEELEKVESSDSKSLAHDSAKPTSERRARYVFTHDE